MLWQCDPWEGTWQDALPVCPPEVSERRKSPLCPQVRPHFQSVSLWIETRMAGSFCQSVFITFDSGILTCDPFPASLHLLKFWNCHTMGRLIYVYVWMYFLRIDLSVVLWRFKVLFAVLGSLHCVSLNCECESCECIYRTTSSRIIADMYLLHYHMVVDIICSWLPILNELRISWFSL